jgi:hypothetical protein
MAQAVTAGVVRRARPRARRRRDASGLVGSAAIAGQCAIESALGDSSIVVNLIGRTDV